MSVSGTTIFFMFVTLIVSIGFPVFLWIFFSRGKPGFSTTVLCGALGFFVPQILIRIPAIQIMAMFPGWVEANENNPYLSITVFALTAAVFETAGRYFVLRVLLKDNLSYYSALGAGIGHGGIESIFLVGFTYINNIIFSLILNSGISTEIPGVEEAGNIILQTPSEMFLMN